LEMLCRTHSHLDRMCILRISIEIVLEIQWLICCLLIEVHAATCACHQTIVTMSLK
jgi:hypothetical protein